MTTPTQERRRAPRRAEDRERRRRQWAATGPYLAMAALVIVAFFVQGDDRSRIEDEGIARDVALAAEAEERSAQIEAEALARDRRICQTDNERAGSIRLFLSLLVSGDGAVSEFERQALQLADEVFAERECPPEPS